MVVIHCSSTYSVVSALLIYSPCLATPTTYLMDNRQVLRYSLPDPSADGLNCDKREGLQVLLGEPGAITPRGSVLY